MTVAPARKTRGRGGTPSPSGAARSSRWVLALPSGFGLVLAGFGVLAARQPGLLLSFAGAAAVLLVWSGALYVSARRAGRAPTLTIGLHRHHWVQACAQTAVLLYWGWHVRFVYAFLPLIVAQLIFAYAFDSLLSWSRRGTYALGFGPFPIILSINLFLWFRPEWFHWQLAMIALGYSAKELIRWDRDGRRTHIFNPSSFPLAVFSLALLLAGASDRTFGTAIATSQFYPPHIYLVIFLAALPGQLLFGVARMTLTAVITVYAISALYFGLNGTYLFYDTHIPIAIFLGMHLLFTDPSTSPRSESGRLLFGVLYGAGTAAFYVILSGLGEPTFYDKLLPVPIMNLLVRRIDRLAAGRLAWLDPSRLGRAWPAAVRNAAFTSVWAAAFLALSAARGVGDHPPGQALPFWYNACDAGSARACTYAEAMTLIYCDNGSGWACNEWGIRQIEAGRPARGAFERACEIGFEPACDNVGRDTTVGDAVTLARGNPQAPDLPIVLRGSKPPLRGYSQTELVARACAQGWPGACPAAPALP